MEKERFCVDIDCTFQDVIQVIENIKERGVVVMDGKKVCGVLTVGDVIRAFAEERSKYAKIDKFYSSHFIYLTEYDLKKAFEIFKKRNLSLIPIIDEKYNLLDVITIRDIMNHINFA